MSAEPHESFDGRELRRYQSLHRRDVAFRFIDAWRAVREVTGYGALEDAAQWSRRVVEGRDE